MNKFAQLPLLAQLGIFLLIPAIVIGVAEYAWFPMAPAPAGTLQEWDAANAAAKAKLKKLQDDNAVFKPYEAKLKQIQAENKQLETQLASLSNVVPNEKDTDSFMRMVRAAGDQTGVQVRRFTPLAPAAKEFYTELPFEIEMDGNWHSLTQFLDRLGALPRITNVSNMGIGPLGTGVKGVKKKYDYTPAETIAAGCTLTTFYRGATAPAKK